MSDKTREAAPPLDPLAERGSTPLWWQLILAAGLIIVTIAAVFPPFTPISFAIAVVAIVWAARARHRGEEALLVEAMGYLCAVGAVIAGIAVFVVSSNQKPLPTQPAASVAVEAQLPFDVQIQVGNLVTGELVREAYGSDREAWLRHLPQPVDAATLDRCMPAALATPASGSSQTIDRDPSDPNAAFFTVTYNVDQSGPNNKGPFTAKARVTKDGWTLVSMTKGRDDCPDGVPPPR